MVQFHPQYEGLRTRRAEGVSSSLKASSQETKEELRLQFKCKVRQENKTEHHLQGRQAGRVPSSSALLVYSGLLLIGQAHHIRKEGPTAFLSLLTQILMSSRNDLMETRGMGLDSMSGHTVARSS